MLYLMRHGIALPPNIDPEKGLSPDGKAAIKHIAKKIKNRVTVDLILHSSKKRARETAEILAASINSPLKESHHILPESDPKIILSEILAEEKNVMIVSHLPFLPNLMELLGVEAINFYPGTIVCLEPKWKISWSANNDI